MMKYVVLLGDGMADEKLPHWTTKPPAVRQHPTWIIWLPAAL